MTRQLLDDLCLELHYGRDLMQSDVLLHLQVVLASSAPKMFAGLEVHAYEWDRDRIVVTPEHATSLRDAALARGTERDAIYDALLAESSHPPDDRRFGSVLLRGRGPGTGGRFGYVQFDTDVPARRSGSDWLWSNSIEMIVSTTRLEGQDRSTWMEAFAADLSRHPDFLWGAAYLRQEFGASNLDTTNNVERSIGRDVRRHLPGVFWLNLFGQPYRDLIGIRPFSSAPAAIVDEDEHRVIVRAFDSPEDWVNGVGAKDELRRHFGEDIFFDRRQPKRRTRVPAFGLRLLAGQAPFVVFTPDGEHFTPLPKVDG